MQTLFYRAKNMIIAVVSLSGNLTKASMFNSIEDFCILKEFRVNGHYTKAPSIVLVNWHPPLPNWVRCNSDGASRESRLMTVSSGIFRKKKV